MFGYLYDWLLDISFYLILVTAATYALPSNSYRKYVRFFSGLVLILMILIPVLSLCGMEEFEIKKLYDEFEAECEKNVSEWMKEVEGETFQIEVEEILIGP